MKKTIITGILFLISLTAFSQENLLSAYLQNYQYQQALEYIEQQEQTPELLFQKATCHKALGNFSAAIDLFGLLLNDDANNIRLRSELASCYKSIFDWKLAAECYLHLSEIDSTNAYFHIQYADMHYHQGGFSEALSIYKNMYEQYQLNSLLKAQAQCYENMNMPDSAMTYYLQAWETDSKDHFSLANFINLSLKQENYLQAKIYSDSYLETDSTHKIITRLNALTYYSMDLYENAITQFEKSYVLGDSSLIVNRSLGLCYYLVKENEPAYINLTRAYEKDSTNNNVLYCLAVTSNEIGKYDESILYFNKLLDKVIPPDMSLYLNYRGLGMAYDKAKLYEEASLNYKRSLNYASPEQRMYLFFDIANIYDLYLNDDKEALYYFGRYKDSLEKYLRYNEDMDEPDADEIRDTKQKLKSLSEYMGRIEAKIKTEE